MPNLNNNKTKVVISAEVTPYEKEAYKAWWEGKYASEADAVRSHIRKVINYDPENQEKNPSNKPAS